MMRIAEAAARSHKAHALTTGEVVGQVASQTLENMTQIDDVVKMPVLRPLIGMDKDEITAEAQRLGTYPISIIPDIRTVARSLRPATRQHELGASTSSVPRAAWTSSQSSSRLSHPPPKSAVIFLY
jgi:adenylyl- and sulfurtransferase ThiI